MVDAANSRRKTGFTAEEIDPAPPPHFYRYCKYSAEVLRLLLTARQLRFSHANFFNDPFDCRPNMGIAPNMGPAEDKLWAEHVARRLVADKKMEEARYQAHVDKLCADEYALANAVSDLCDTVTKELRDHIRVLCLAERGDDPLMWSLYANSHKGMCLEFDSSVYPFNTAERVDYTQIHPTFDYIDNARVYIPTFLWKAQYWEHEREWRILAEPAGYSHEFVECSEGFVDIHPSALTGVICGGEMPDEHVLELASIVRASSPRMPIKIADLEMYDRSVSLVEILLPK